jgi:hypothetical protein
MHFALRLTRRPVGLDAIVKALLTYINALIQGFEEAVRKGSPFEWLPVMSDYRPFEVVLHFSGYGVNQELG